MHSLTRAIQCPQSKPFLRTVSPDFVDVFVVIRPGPKRPPWPACATSPASTATAATTATTATTAIAGILAAHGMTHPSTRRKRPSLTHTFILTVYNNWMEADGD